MSQSTRSPRRGQLALFHVTPRRNLESIYQLGIDPSFSRSTWPACWFVSPSMRQWAIRHVADKYQLRTSDLVCIRVVLSRRNVVRRNRGVWTCASVVADFVAVRPCSNIYYTTFGTA